jgi:hypothetical protein
MSEVGSKMETKMNSGTSCNRESDLVTYLYDEATREERSSFELHLEGCVACRNELSSFASVRNSLGAWNLGLEPAAPRVQVTVQRNSIETLRDLFTALSSWPTWLKLVSGTAVAAAAVLVMFAAAGTRVDVRAGTISFGFGPGQSRSGARLDEAAGRDAHQDVQLTRAEVETMIAARVAAANAEDRKRQEELSVQVASLSAQLATAGQSRGKMAVELATLRAEQRALAARGQSLGEWLFAANGSRETWGGADERDN